MKRIPYKLVLALLILLALGACGAAPQEDIVLPTLARLPSLTPTPQPAVANTPAPLPTALPTKLDVPVGEASATPNAIVLPSPLEISASPTPVNELGLDTYPQVLELGAELTLQGTFTTEDPDSGKALLTSRSGQTIALLVDPFTASIANNQFIQLTGIVERQPDAAENALRVTAVNMLDSPLESALPADGIPEELIVSATPPS